ncbi:HNH endonuclease signature motif containing protein [Mycolicibacterium iranicum]|nr:HNH endonuclease signature motif containing protein [Mycolicibacterium iranicum]
MFDRWSDGDVLSAVEGAHRQVAVAMARSLAGIFELLERRTAEELAIDLDVASMITGFQRTVVEVGAVLNMTSAKARGLVRQADALHTRLPAVGALLAAGEVDWTTTELVLSRTDLVEEEWMAQLDATLAEQIQTWSSCSRTSIRNAIDVEINALDPEAVKKRRERAYDERAVSVEVGLDGIAVVRATMTAPEGAAPDTRLTALAKTVCPADPRSLRARRADAFTAIQNGRVFICTCGHPDCPRRAERAPEAAVVEAAPVPEPRVVLTVIASADTVAGHSQAPGYLAGYGVIDAALVRELAAEATRRLVEAPPFEERQALTYRPCAALARFIRSRDLTCRFPGCTVPAQRCDIDHTEPFNHDDPAAGGWTVPWNLACYCREHHRHKTHDDGWRDQQLADGTIIWTSPSGRTLRTELGGAALWPALATPRSPEERKRVAAARKRLHQQRHTSTHNRYRNQAAKEEIRQRCWRNDFRRRHVLFKGYWFHDKPDNRSPYARFIANPIEPEPLEPGWQPPPQHHTNPDEPPPF